MDAVGRRRAGAGTSVVAGSVWESRMKLDEVRGGIKVFNGEENSDEGNGIVGTKMKRGQTGVVGAASTGKRKTWKSETFEGFEKNPIQIAKGKTEPQRNSEEKCKELSVSVDGLKKSPIQVRKLRSEGSKEIIVAADKAERSPIGMRKPRSESLKSPVDLSKQAGEGIGRNSVQLRKGKSDSIKVLGQSVKDNAGSNGAIQLRKAKSESNKDLVESEKGIDASFEEIEKNPVENGKTGSDDTCKEFGVCQEKVISSSVSNVGVPNSAPKALVHEDRDDHEDEGDEEEEEVDEEIEVVVEKKSLGDEEQEEVDEEIEVEVEVEKKSLGDEEQEEVDEEIEVEVEKKSLDIKEISTPEKKPNKVINEEKKPNKVINEKKVVNEVKKLHFERKEIRKLYQVHQKPEPISLNVKKQPPVIKRATVHSNFAKPTFPASNEYQNFPESHNRLQSFVDLIMWKDIPRSVFIFGIGTFIILSSSYTKDLNISFISVISYLGLVYLAAIFLFRSIICRGVLDVDNTSCVLGEEESIWLVKLVLPYLNEFLLKLKALFSGDPSTTMKLAALLFVLARCGSFITIWTMAKLGFFGVFTVPKVCSLYSHHITAYAKFWVRRFRDAWNSCSHKKALTVAVFLLVWNLSSIVARIWAVFMLFVAFRYYQQSLVLDDDWVEDDAADEETWHEPIGGHVHGNGPTFVDITKQKKNF